jgi:hypothetical protein
VSKQLTEADKFLIFHSNPTEIRENQLSEINSLIDQYPYCQSLHFLSAKAAANISEKSTHLSNAAAFASSRETLYNFLENTQSFTTSINEDLDEVEHLILETEHTNKDFGQAFGVDLNQMIVKEQPLEIKHADDLDQENEIEVISNESNEIEISIENNLAFADSDIEVSNHDQIAEKIEEENELLQRVENVGIENENILEEEKDQTSADVEHQDHFSEPLIENEIESQETHHDLNNEELNILINEKIEDEIANENNQAFVEHQEAIEEESSEETTVTPEKDNAIEIIEIEKKDDQAFAENEQQENIQSESIEEQSAEANVNQENNQANAEVEEQESIESDTIEQPSAEANKYENDLVEEVPHQTEEQEAIVNQENNQANAEVEDQENIESDTIEQPSAEANKYENDLVEEVPHQTEEQEAIVNQENNQANAEVEEEENIESETIEQPSAEANKYENDLVEEVANQTEELEATVNQENNQANAEVEQSDDIENFTNQEFIDEESEINSVDQKTNNKNTEDKPKRKSLEEILFDNPVQSDFFAFTKEKNQVKEPLQEDPKIDGTVSQYNDDTLPYTFLWWLNKTRKEHSLNNNQPYSSAKPTQSTVKEKPLATDTLNHQIAENIFHLRSVDDVEKNQQGSNFTVPYDFRQKEHKIIEKFIKEEPQIKPPAANKIDTENKAKKSSEDTNEVVSETLAKIYVEQMLYHKALDVYKKLSLKYPEKSAYFASQIKYLELKVN